MLKRATALLKAAWRSVVFCFFELARVNVDLNLSMQSYWAGEALETLPFSYVCLVNCVTRAHI